MYSIGLVQGGQFGHIIWPNFCFVSEKAYCSWYLLIYLSRYLDREIAKGPFRPSSQAATCYYQSNHSKIEAISGAGTIFGQGGQDQERQSREREIKVFAEIRAFFVPKRSVFQKEKKIKKIKLNKKIYAGLGASSCPEMKRTPKKKKKNNTVNK